MNRQSELGGRQASNHWRCDVQRASQAKPAAGIAFSSRRNLNPEQSAARWSMQMLITLSVGEVKTVYVRCDEQQRGATPKAAQTCIESQEHWHCDTSLKPKSQLLGSRPYSLMEGDDNRSALSS